VTFYRLELLMLLWLLPLLAALLLYARARRRRSLRIFADASRLSGLAASRDPRRRLLKALLLLAAIALIVVALARPAWHPVQQKLERYGRDVVFVLDVSRSMLAEDLRPNRLERAKLAIRDVLSVMRGDRVALVAFAGDAVVPCPRPLEYGFFRIALDGAGPDTVGRGGTMIGDALRTVLSEVFDDQDRQYKDIILLTDGEDHESFPVEAAAEAGRRGVRLFAVGLGDDREGRRVPIGEGGRKRFLTYREQEVWSQLDAATLRRMAAATPQGRYLHVATGAVDLGDIYEKVMAGAEKRKLESESLTRYEEKFQIFIGLALLLLVLETFIGERRRERSA